MRVKRIELTNFLSYRQAQLDLGDLTAFGRQVCNPSGKSNLVAALIFSFKRYGRRVFLMAPIHHHFEMKAWSETKIMVRFWILCAILCAFAFALYYRYYFQFFRG